MLTHFRFLVEEHMHLKRVRICFHFLAPPGLSTAGAHMQFVHACAVETHVLFFARLLKHSFNTT